MGKPVLVDTREPQSIIDKARAMLSPQWDIMEAALAYGDFLFPVEKVVIERKTALDLLSSIGDGRLTSQVLGMVGMAKVAVVLVTGSLLADNNGKVIADGRTTKWEWSSVQAALMSAQRMGAYVVQCPSSCWPDTIRSIVEWASKPRRDSTEVIVQPPRGPLLTRADKQVEMMCLLPHVGPVAASRLWEYTGKSLAWCLYLLTGGPCPDKLKGIGPATIRDNKEFFGLEPDQYITTLYKEKDDG